MHCIFSGMAPIRLFVIARRARLAEEEIVKLKQEKNNV
jgi:hypothetical protein